MGQDNQVRRILIKFDTQGDGDLKAIKNSLSSVNKQVKESTSVLKSFQSAFQTILGASFLGVGISSLTTLADSYQKLGDRIKVFEGSQEKTNSTMAGIAQVADRTKSSIEDVATVYSRLSLSLKETGITSGSLLFITEQLQNSFRLSGSTAAEATASVIQLSQGLASGQLRGQELRSVLEQNAVFGGLLAEKLGVARGALLKYAEAAGGIKSKTVIEAILLGSEKLNSEAAILGVTFAEATQKGINKFTVALGELNKEFGLSANYSKAIDVLVNNLGLLEAGAIALAVTAIPLLVTQLEALSASLLANPITAIAYAIVAGITYSIIETDRFVGSMLKLRFTILETFGEASAAVNDFGKTMVDLLNGRTGSILSRYFENQSASSKAYAEEQRNNFEDVTKSFEANEKARSTLAYMGQANFEQQQKKLRAELEKTLKFGQDLKNTSPKSELEALNTSFNSGKIGVLEYNKQLTNLTDKMNSKKGPTALFKATSKVMEENLNREFEYGIINLETFIRRTKELQAFNLEESFRKGAIGISEYNRKLVETSDSLQPGAALYVGTEDFLKKIGTVSQNVAGAITSTFSRLEDSLLEFIKKGKFSFKDFASAIIEDINRIILRALIIRPLAEGVLSFATSPGSGSQGLGVNANGSSTTEGGFAMGGAFNRGTQFFADGGVVNRATSFGMYGGKKGVMGEAGPEAILPLTRGTDGKLGVQSQSTPVVVNIVNNTGAEISQTESTGPNGEKTLDIIIANKTRELFASGGMDKTMRQIYGVNRRGN